MGREKIIPIFLMSLLAGVNLSWGIFEIIKMLDSSLHAPTPLLILNFVAVFFFSGGIVSVAIKQN
ncbi:MAG: hypothetical protein ACD_56C00025G0001 [uncultured bacterium]|nr:MAG: hypothetical protein ACD_56C00025G0001 [uncultured bacterium]